MRFGLQPTPQFRTWEQLRRFHVVADELSVFESVWSADHFEPSGFDAAGAPIGIPGPQVEAWTMTAAVAEATNRVRLGPLVTCVAFRNPALLARMVAVCDIVSGGRIELGLGAGWNEGEARAFGFRLGPMRERMDRFAEALEVLHSLFTNEQTDFEGRYFTFEGARIDPKPVQQPHPSFVIGGTGEQRTIPLVARWAQQWNVGPTNRETLAAKRAVLERECARIDRDPASIEVSCNMTLRPESDLAALAARAHSYTDLGVDRVIFTIVDPTVTPAALEPLAAALEAAGPAY